MLGNLSVLQSCTPTMEWILKSSVRGPQVAIQQSATDPITGAIDMDMIQTGVSASARIALQQLAQEVQALLISKLPVPGRSYRMVQYRIAPCIGFYNEMRMSRVIHKVVKTHT
jgi:hypothetical protein